MAAITRAEIEARSLTLSQSVLAEIEAAREAGEIGEPATEWRCHVCCEAESKNLVNALIAKGLTNREISECCGGINRRRQENDDTRLIHARNVRGHRRYHFDVQEPVRAAYRKIVERRAEEVDLDHINGVENVVVPLAVFETVMVKGFGRLVEENTEVTVKETMEAAVKLHDYTNVDDEQRKMADMMYTMDRIVRAAQQFIPADQQDAFLAKVEGREVITTTTVAAPVPAVREFAPRPTRDEHDEF